jgi:FMN phosphatase YigB (HAD superfamily)
MQLKCLVENPLESLSITEQKMSKYLCRDTKCLNYDAIIFDHDNTLAPAIGVGQDLFEPVFDAIRAQIPSEFQSDPRYLTRVDQALEACWYTAFDAVADLYEFTAEMTAAGKRAFVELKVPASSRYAHYEDSVLVKELNQQIPCFLVTSGFTTFQNSKIDHLKMRDWFDDIVIDAVEVPEPLGKKSIFQALAAKHGPFHPARVLVVGDNPISEIAAGNAAGMHTVQVLRPGVAEDAQAMYHVLGLRDLWPILNLANGTFHQM